MYEITRRIEIDAGHRVPDHKSKCRNLHGHRYVIEAILGSDHVIVDDFGDSESGMLVDFGIIKEVLVQTIDEPYDHALILWNQDPLVKDKWDVSGSANEASVVDLLRDAFEMKVALIPVIPTAENLAQFWLEAFDAALEAKLRDVHQEIGLTVAGITVWETPNCKATAWAPEHLTPEIAHLGPQHLV